MSRTLAQRAAATAQIERSRGRGQVRGGAQTPTRFEPGTARGKTMERRPTEFTNRGRGIAGAGVRGRVDMNPYQGHQFQDPQDMAYNEGMEAPQGNSLEQRSVYAGGYTMISPNEKKRQQIKEKAARETRQYEEYKQRNKVTSVSYVGTVGGRETEWDARQQQMMMQQGLNKTNRLLREQERKSRQKEAEDLELAQKKEAARRQSELNEQRDKEGKKDEMRRVNQAFLDRLEAQNKSSNQQSAGQTGSSYQNRPTSLVKSSVVRTPQTKRDVSATSFGTSAAEVGHTAGRQRSEFTGTTASGNHTGHDAFADGSNMYGRQNPSVEREDRGSRAGEQWEFQTQAGRGGMLAESDAENSFSQAFGCSDFQHDEEFDRNVNELQNMLPHFDPLMLSNALQAANGSIDYALQLLGV